MIYRYKINFNYWRDVHENFNIVYGIDRELLMLFQHAQMIMNLCKIRSRLILRTIIACAVDLA